MKYQTVTKKLRSKGGFDQNCPKYWGINHTYETLKYGVANSRYDTFGGKGNRRPASQVSRFNRMEKYKKQGIVQYRIMYRTWDRATALRIELLLVSLFYSRWGVLPVEQYRPRPTTIFPKR